MRPETITRCHEWLTGIGTCETPKTTYRTATGYLAVCPRCTARKMGRCWQCGGFRSNTHPQAVFCDACGKQRLKASNDASRTAPAAKARRKQYDRQRYLAKKANPASTPEAV